MADAQVTVLMSVHNGRPFLDQSIESVLAQTYTNFEFVIIDDASTDGSRARIRAWAERDNRIRPVLYDHNRGLGHALHDGVRMAHGRLIARMDSDDVALPTRLQRQVEFLHAHEDVDVLGGGAFECDSDGSITGQRQYPTRHADIARVIWTCPVIHPSVMFRRAPVMAVGSYDPRLRKRQDYDLWFRCLAGGLTFANLPEPVIKYRITEDHYRRNDWRVAWAQARIGWRGCQLVDAGPLAYMGVAVPLIRSLLPHVANKWLHQAIAKVDPRRTQHGFTGSTLPPLV